MNQFTITNLKNNNNVRYTTTIMSQFIHDLISWEAYDVIQMPENYNVNGIIYPTLKRPMIIDGKQAYENSYYKLRMNYFYKYSAAKIHHKTVMKQLTLKEQGYAINLTKK